MRTKVIIILSVLFFSSSFCQNKGPEHPQNPHLTKSLQLSDEEQLKLIVQVIIQYYGESFKYYQELISGSYNFEKNLRTGEKEYYLNIAVGNESRKSAAKIRLSEKKKKNGAGELMFEKSEIEKYIDYGKFDKLYRKSNMGSGVEIIDRSKILFDQMILKNDDNPERYWRILNRDWISTYFENQNGETAQLFKLLEAGVLIPYGTSGQFKVLTIDRDFHSIIYFDSEIDPNSDDPINNYYGTYGPGHGEFLSPTGIATGREIHSGSYVYYPVYIADNHNFRIVRVNFVLNEANPKLSYFQDDSFTDLAKANLPYDIAYFENSSDSTSDKLWVNEGNPLIPSISCYTKDGTKIQRFFGYLDSNTGSTYLFQSNTVSRLSVFYDYVVALSFIDNIRNCLVSAQLNPDGTARFVSTKEGDFIMVHDLLYFPESEKINSVRFLRTRQITALWPYVWVTSPNRIHCLKMNSSAHTQYLASTDFPYNSPCPYKECRPFSKLMNTLLVNGYSDMGTVEQWSDPYGIRRYLPFADIHSDVLYNYCADTTDQMRWHAVFTNDCFIDITAERRNQSNGWDSVIIKSITGQEFNNYEATIYRFAGNNEASVDSYIRIRLDLPLMDYVLGGKVRMHATLRPDNYNPYAISSDYVHVDYEVDVSKRCLPLPGGCPFVYVRGLDTTYKVDNNILYRYEFSGTGDYQKDAYMLAVTPGVVNGKVTVSVAENEHDVSTFDRFQLVAVDHPEGTLLGITESGEYVLYDTTTIKNADNATLNGSIDITNQIKYNPYNTSPVKVANNDKIFADYNNQMSLVKKRGNQTDKKADVNSRKTQNSKNWNKRLMSSTTTADSISVIMDLRNWDTLNVSQKNWAGTMNVHTVNGADITDKYFARRERSSVVIVPVVDANGPIPDDVDKLNIIWLADSKIKYISLATVHFGSDQMSINTLPLNKASQITLSSTSNVTNNLSDEDSLYVVMDTSSILTLEFDASGLPEPSPGYVRDFVLVTVGKYTASSSSNSPQKGNNSVPLVMKLYNNYPNPFNPTTRIKYDISRNVPVKMTVYDILGREVKVLVNEIKKAGSYVAEFDASNYASGVYFYRIEAGDFVEAKKMVLVK